MDGGFKITKPDGNMLVEVYTGEFTNGFMTYVRGTLFDELGKPGMKPEGEGTRVIGEARLVLDTPVTPP